MNVNYSVSSGEESRKSWMGMWWTTVLCAVVVVVVVVVSKQYSDSASKVGEIGCNLLSGRCTNHEE